MSVLFEQEQDGTGPSSHPLATISSRAGICPCSEHQSQEVYSLLVSHRVGPFPPDFHIEISAHPVSPPRMANSMTSMSEGISFFAAIRSYVWYI